MQELFLKNKINLKKWEKGSFKEKLDFYGKIVYNKAVIFLMKTEKTLLNDISVCADSVGEKKL